MTFRDRQWALLADLLAERRQFPEWAELYDRKIATLREAMSGGSNNE